MSATSDDQPAQASNEELLKSCLDHYERVSMIAHEWNNQVPQAIRALLRGLNVVNYSGRETL